MNIHDILTITNVQAIEIGLSGFIKRCETGAWGDGSMDKDICHACEDLSSNAQSLCESQMPRASVGRWEAEVGECRGACEPASLKFQSGWKTKETCHRQGESDS